MAGASYYCPECACERGEHEVWTEYLQRGCCPCGAVLHQESHMGWTDAEAVLQSDVSAIDHATESWAAARGGAVEKHCAREWVGDYLWELPGGAGDGLNAVVSYEKRLPNACRLSLLTERCVRAVARRPEGLRRACAREGVEPFAVEGKGACWGASQLLGTAALVPEAFDPVLARLRRAVAEAQAGYEGRGE